jgi:hypothetical protein
MSLTRPHPAALAGGTHPDSAGAAASRSSLQGALTAAKAAASAPKLRRRLLQTSVMSLWRRSTPFRHAAGLDAGSMFVYEQTASASVTL